jgi:hypothetical protein
MSKIHFHFANNYDNSLAPIPAIKFREWWEDNNATKNHARHCLPLTMVNSLGYYILSPGTFRVTWNGDIHHRAIIDPIEKSSHFEVDDHAAFGSFTVQAKFIPVTENEGEFIYVKGVPNERGVPYSCMEGLIEAWWNKGIFGLVFLLNQPGTFTVYWGQPIAQIFMYKGEAGAATFQAHKGYPEGHEHWMKRRSRPEYRKDLDYMKGLTSYGDSVPSHITSWKHATKFK